jgi:hypothetical protein
LPLSGAPSITKVWPLPVSAKKLIPDFEPLALLLPVQLTVHSIRSFLIKIINF